MCAAGVICDMTTNPRHLHSEHNHTRDYLPSSFVTSQQSMSHVEVGVAQQYTKNMRVVLSNCCKMVDVTEMFAKNIFLYQNKRFIYLTYILSLHLHTA